MVMMCFAPWVTLSVSVRPPTRAEIGFAPETPSSSTVSARQKRASYLAENFRVHIWSNNQKSLLCVVIRRQMLAQGASGR